ncbi:MAG TPA: response regulator [Steroidobacteraceae bacterium]|jgi:two-component system chemotaxis sensor kinase CheA|nr:response regulator [Steroidobacteraceae bacterium]
MSGVEEELLRVLRATFKVEAAEHLQVIGTGLLELEKAAAPADRTRLIETVFRAAHSLKGAARAVNFGDIETLCQSLEGLFAAWKRGESAPTPETLDEAHRVLNAAWGMMSESAGMAAAARTHRPAEDVSGRTETRAEGGPAEAETVRIAVSALDARLLEAEEMLAAKLTAEQWSADLAALEARFEQWRKQWSRIQPRMRRLRQRGGQALEGGATPATHELAEFFDWNHDYVRALEGSVTGLRRRAEQNRLLVTKLVDELLENSKKLLMLPLSTISALLFKVVRDLCRDQGKEAVLTVRGEEVTIDKRILEELKDPLIHLLRNCIDHGVETPEQRRRAGKPPQATIAVAVAPIDGNQVEVSVSDDGAGVDLDKVKLAAGRHGLLAPDISGSDGEAAALGLVFEADVSTSPIITQVSGRGLGLAIVREKTEKLGGRVAIESRRGAGTVIRMIVPLTLATFRGILIRAAQRSFVVPTAHVGRVTRFKAEDVQTVEGRRALALNGRAVALVDLAEVLQLPSGHGNAGSNAPGIVLVLGAGEHTVAFAVNEVLDEREVLIKRFAKPLSRVRNIAGATVLGSGEVAPILNVPDLLKSARTAGAAPAAPDSRGAVPTQPEAAAGRILVAEDSITSRMLLKGILESAGYDVTTAVDGIDAFTTLRSGHFDLVVSDVEMPRLNGFDLTARIRADRTLAEMPVILVTALESREDRERGIEVGANAYLVKSSLDQDDLLEALQRLI